MKRLLCAFVLVIASLSAHALTKYTVSNSTAGCPTQNVNSLTCQEFLTVFNACQVAAGRAVGTACSGDPLTVNTVITRQGVTYTDTITAIASNCAAGTHFDISTASCVEDVAIAVASCMPSIRTISPCPSGYAPTNAIPAGSGAPSPFTSAFDGLPIQDMIYAVGIAICGLLGISVGVKLV